MSSPRKPSEGLVTQQIVGDFLLEAHRRMKGTLLSFTEALAQVINEFHEPLWLRASPPPPQAKEQWPPCHNLSNTGVLHPSAEPPCNGDRCPRCAPSPVASPSPEPEQGEKVRAAFQAVEDQFGAFTDGGDAMLEEEWDTLRAFVDRHTGHPDGGSEKKSAGGSPLEGKGTEG